ncbi:Membrane protein involved in the export of O-antigen and teichoic acid [Clostridium cavendishii DSM 21758]|uniref:Membrane protein involved in the export of O-antigen and teichoic acid n=1 Tax=Clostridium cavendishii DSM 21758 TaxID=1121302 RepID=A0A1M6KR05_9CLOT|nr:flippase [Clostridium cavendishii]SHJ61346.1 Membrane protein involved in the export of O-antigen and teichoic acid [Clostridium cavendishii DSM 21758]
MRKIIKNFLSIGFAGILGQLITFLAMAYYARVLGKSIFGYVTLAQQMMLYFTTIVLFGLQTYGMREIAKSKDKLEEILGDIIIFRLVVAVFSFLVLLLLSFIIKKGVDFQIVFLLFGLMLFPTALNIDWFFNGIEVMKHNAIYTLIKNIIPAIIIVLVINYNRNVFIIPIATVIGLFIGFIYQYYILIYKMKIKISINTNFEKFKKYFYIGIPFLASAILSMINNNCDKIILGFTVSDAELGLYQAAYTFISFFINVEGLIFTPVFPSFSKYYYGEKLRELNEICDFTAKTIIMVVMPLLIGGVLLSREIIVKFYGGDFGDAYKPFIVLLVYIFILFIREIYAYELNAWGFEKYYLKIIFISSMMNLFLNLLITPKYGYMAAAFITTITEIINLVFMRMKSRSIIKTKEMIYMFKILPFSISMGILVFIMKRYNINLFVNIAISSVFYFALVIKFKYIDLNFIKRLRE